jgi:DNA-binding transcriptional LysR family regulator
MDTIESMRVFVRVVESGSFVAVARRLDTTTGYVSRTISQLETHLRARLLNRTTRCVALTEVGQRYLDRCEHILSQVDDAEAEARDAQRRPVGRLKVYCLSSFGLHNVVPAVLRYQERYPSVKVDLTFGQRVPDMLAEGFDVSLVLAPRLPDSGLIANRLGSVACASPSYISKHGSPENLSDLRKHTCLQLSSPVFPTGRWILNGPNGLEESETGSAVFTVNMTEALETAIRTGSGIGILPAAYALPGLRDGTLVRVLPQYTHQELNLFALHPSRKYVDAKMRTWIDFLEEHVPATLAADTTELSSPSC